MLPGYAIEDGAAVHFADDELLRVVSSRPAATAYFVEKQVAGVHERALINQYLPAVQAAA